MRWIVTAFMTGFEQITRRANEHIVSDHFWIDSGFLLMLMLMLMFDVFVLKMRSWSYGGRRGSWGGDIPHHTTPHHAHKHKFCRILLESLFERMMIYLPYSTCLGSPLAIAIAIAVL